MRTRRKAPAASPTGHDTLLWRIRGEFREMPGLQLTRPQAARLLGLEPAACGAMLDQLMELGFLRRRERGQYVLADGR